MSTKDKELLRQVQKNMGPDTAQRVSQLLRQLTAYRIENRSLRYKLEASRKN